MPGRGVSIGEDDDYTSLSERLAELGGEILVRALDALEGGRLDFKDQDESVATYAEKIAPEERHLDPARPATELERVVRAIAPHIGTHLELEGGGRLRVCAASASGAGLPPARSKPTAGDSFSAAQTAPFVSTSFSLRAGDR